MADKNIARYVLRILVITYLFFLVGWPVWLIVHNTFADGLDALHDALTSPTVVFSLKLTLAVAVQAVLINTIFGVGISLLLVRYEFPGKRALSALIDLPLSVSPVVVGLALILVYGPRDGWFGVWLHEHGFNIIFSTTGIILATTFISLPLVIREIVPVLTERGIDEEQAASSLGASPAQAFFRVTLPAIKWALVYGMVLTFARALGEFGAVKIVSGNLEGRTQTATLLVEQKYQDFEQSTAYATAFLLAAVAVACIAVVTILRSHTESASAKRGTS
ncbi:sulfate ABC transporter permease [Timonella sp. A28]|uniref:sulfate ABC transporter permease n=1 Tax=Timonella sp. A28 TaxID=3442640 RepID=UPI003EBD0E29